MKKKYKRMSVVALLTFSMQFSTNVMASPEQDCVDKINELRSTIGLYPLQRWNDKESCVTRTIQVDAEAGAYHQSIRNGDNCDAGAQNVCAGSAYSSITDLINKCPLDHWRESEDVGLPQAHYKNLASTTTTHVACGFYKKSDGSIWANMNFGTP